MARKTRATTLREGGSMKADVDAHGGRHESGGPDQISVQGLAGDLADPQDPKQEVLEDMVSALVSGGTNVTTSYDDANGVLTVGTSALNEEEVEDVVSGLLATDANLTLNYDDTNDVLTIGLADDVEVNSLTAGSADIDVANIKKQPDRLYASQFSTGGSGTHADPYTGDGFRLAQAEASSGQTVVIDGVFEESTPFTISQSFHLKGYRMGSTSGTRTPSVIKLPSDYAATGPFLTINTDNDFMWTSYIEDVGFDMTNQPNSAGNHGIKVNETTNQLADIHFDRVIVWEAGARGLFVQGASHSIYVTDSYFEHTHGRGLQIEGMSHAGHVRGCFFTSCNKSDQDFESIAVKGNVNVIDTFVERTMGTGRGFQVQGGCHLYACHARENDGTGFVIGGDYAPRIIGCKSTDNGQESTNSDRAGFWLATLGGSATSDPVVAHCQTGNVSGATQQTGIIVDTGTSDARIQNLNDLGNASAFVDNSGDRTRWDGVIGGGPLGGVDLSVTAGQALEEAVDDGTNTPSGNPEKALWVDSDGDGTPESWQIVGTENIITP